MIRVQHMRPCCSINFQQTILISMIGNILHRVLKYGVSSLSRGSCKNKEDSIASSLSSYMETSINGGG